VERNDSICIEMPLYAADLFSIGKIRRKDNLLRFVNQITSALAFLHNTNIIHRDIKPGNILIDNIDEDKTNFILTDMGSSRLCMYGDGARYTDEATTAIYQAPELWLAKNKGKFTQATDAWALGAVIFELQHGVHLIDPVVFARKREPLLRATGSGHVLLNSLEEALKNDSNHNSGESPIIDGYRSPIHEDDAICLETLNHKLYTSTNLKNQVSESSSDATIVRSKSNGTNTKKGGLKTTLHKKSSASLKSVLNSSMKSNKSIDEIRPNITNYFLVMQKLAQHIQLSADDKLYLYAYNELRYDTGCKQIKFYNAEDAYAGNSFIRLNPAERSLPTKHKPNENKITSAEIFSAYKDIIPNWDPENRKLIIGEDEDKSILLSLFTWLKHHGYNALPPTEQFITDQYTYLKNKLIIDSSQKYTSYAIALVSAMLGFMYFQADANIETIDIFSWGVSHGINEETFPQLVFDGILHSAPLFRI